MPIKKTSLLFAFVFSIAVSSSYAQWEFGVRGGYNMSFAYDNQQKAGGSPASLYQGGVYAIFKAYKKVSLQPELVFSAQGFDYDFRKTQTTKYGTGDVRIQGEDRMYYVALPVLFRINFNRIHMVLGPQFSALTKQSSSCEVTAYFPGTTTMVPPALMPADYGGGQNPFHDPNFYERIDFAGVIGAGLDFNRFNIGARYYHGFSDITTQEPARYRESLTQSRCVSFIVGYKLFEDKKEKGE